MKKTVKIIITCMSTVGMLVPTLVWFGLKSVVNPAGFWENLAVVGLGIWFFGGAQLVLLIWWLVGNIMLWCGALD